MSTPYVSEKLERLAALEERTALPVAIMVKSDAEEVVRERASELDVEIERVLPSGVILAEIPRESFDTFLETRGITSVTLQNEMEIME